MTRRKNSKIFNMGAIKSPYVLGLSRDPSIYSGRDEKIIKPSQKVKLLSKRTEPHSPASYGAGRSPASYGAGRTNKTKEYILTKEEILSELENIEDYDARLASDLNSLNNDENVEPRYVPSSSFFNKEIEASGNSFSGEVHNIRNFMFIAGAFTLLIFGAFFAQRSIVANYGNTQKGAELSEDFEAPQRFPQNSFSLSAIKSFDFDFNGISDLGSKFSSILNLAGMAKDFYAITPVLFGYDEPKRYMIVFQNSSELRPTGGFIGSYALVEISNGEITNLFVDGIYNADGQLTVNVVPPKPFQHITTAWSTHDANWFLDFPASAEKIMWFYEKTGAEKLHGIMSLNVRVIEELLALTGPLSLPGYDLVVDSGNFRDEVQYEVEIAYDRELNQPKKILADLTPVLFERLFETLKSSGKIKGFVSLLTEFLEEKDIMFYSRDESVQGFFEKQGWAGSIVSGAPSDYLAVVHSNIGGYKTDKFMDDDMAYNIEIKEDGSVLGNLVVKRTHNGGDSEYWWYNRKNIDYLKVYVPEGAKIIFYSGGARREVDDPADYEGLGFTHDPDIAVTEEGASTFGAVDIFSESGKTVFGTWLITAPKQSTEFKISYKLPDTLEFKNGFTKYDLYIQKQPGTHAQTNINLSAPPSWEVTWDNVVDSFVLDKDRVVGYIFRKK